MLQYFRFNKSIEAEREFRIITGSAAFKSFSVRILKLLLLLYSTIFLAVAIPFKWTYFIGGMLSFIFLVRIASDMVKYFRFREGKIAVGPRGVEFLRSGKSFRMAADDITFCEINVLGSLVVRERYTQAAFPVNLLTADDRAALLELMQDMAPGRSRLFRKVYEIFDAILVAFILAMHIRQYFIQAYYIPTGSMEDTLQVGDHLLVEKITYGPLVPRMIGMLREIRLWGLRGIQRGDIVIFKPPGDDERDFIKRCIAIAGDIFHINEDDGYVYVNGRRVEEPYVKCPRIVGKNCTDYRSFGKRALEGKVPPGHILVLGDNRTNSQDSRYFGYVPLERVRGKALVLYWNSSHILGSDADKRRDFFFLRLGLIR
ncbi:MAG TPA: signal peptidase I [Spirochaetota bacterium]|nr:signal peptidase I [Spirochaetota bacterium]